MSGQVVRVVINQPSSSSLTNTGGGGKLPKKPSTSSSPAGHYATVAGLKKACKFTCKMPCNTETDKCRSQKDSKTGPLLHQSIPTVCSSIS